MMHRPLLDAENHDVSLRQSSLWTNPLDPELEISNNMVSIPRKPVKKRQENPT